METIDYGINDDIVSIKSHKRCIHKEGETYKCLGLKPCDCKCSDISVNIGIKSQYPVGSKVYCPSCLTIFTNDGIWWVNARSFKKLDTLVNIDELTEILEQPLYS